LVITLEYLHLIRYSFYFQEDVHFVQVIFLIITLDSLV